MRRSLLLVVFVCACALLLAPGVVHALEPAGCVILATGANYPDALAGGLLSSALEAPILLTQKDLLPPETAAEIVRRGTPKVIILGGIGVVSDQVKSALQALGITDIERLGGNNRYETAALIAKRSETELTTSRVATIEASNVMKLDPYVTLTTSAVNGSAGPHIMFTGVNLHVRSGAGVTSSANGLGNLIVGYNEMRGATETERTGSHTLVVGRSHKWTSYGGLLAGSWNTLTAPYSSVSGGYYGIASGIDSSVSSGYYNTASGMYSSVSGGAHNTASVSQSSVSGGQYNTASGSQSSVSGGSHNTASGSFSSVSGGHTNTASGTAGSVSGGFQRSVTGLYDWMAGSLFEDL